MRDFHLIKVLIDSLLTPRRQDASFLLQTVFNFYFHNLGLTEFFHHFSSTQKIRFFFQMNDIKFLKFDQTRFYRSIMTLRFQEIELQHFCCKLLPTNLNRVFSF